MGQDLNQNFKKVVGYSRNVCATIALVGVSYKQVAIVSHRVDR